MHSRVTERCGAMSNKEKEKWTEKAKKGIQGIAGSLSGKDLEHLIHEHSELYTKVTLGLYQDLTAQSRLLKELRENDEKHAIRLGETHEQMAQMQQTLETHLQEMAKLNDMHFQVESRLVRKRWEGQVALAALCIALVALGGVIWIAL